MNKKKKLMRVYFVVHSDRRLPTETEYDVDEYPSSISCYTNKKDARKDCTALNKAYGSPAKYCVVSCDVIF